MKITLFRHFKVKNQPPVVCNSEEYNLQCKEYDRSPIIPQVLTTEIIAAAESSPICYSSPMERALDTARSIYKKSENIIVSPDLVEVPMFAMFNTKIRLPFHLWNFINRMGWLLNSKRLPETRSQTKKRAARFLSNLIETAEENILIVTHGFFMLTLQEELVKRGFEGKAINRPRHGELYEFTRRKNDKKNVKKI
jgi:hypothetical protein